MWIKKSDSDIEYENKIEKQRFMKYRFPKTLAVSLGTSFLFCVGQIVLYLTVGDGGKGLGIGDPIKLKELPGYYPSLARFFFWATFVVLIFFYIFPKFLYVNEKSDSLYCEKCKKVHTYNKNKKCTCGESMDFLITYRWIDEQKQRVADKLMKVDWLELYRINKDEKTST